MQMFEVWAEGYAATGERGTAQLVGSTQAETFDDACRQLHTPDWGTFTPAKDGRPPMYWGCRLFPTEAEARRSYG